MHCAPNGGLVAQTLPWQNGAADLRDAPRCGRSDKRTISLHKNGERRAITSMRPE
jgi:hypothetical protein